MSSNYVDLVNANLGRKVTTPSGVLSIYGLAAATGKLKNGQDVPYLVLGNDTGKQSIHPRRAFTLLTKGVSDDFTLDGTAAPIAAAQEVKKAVAPKAAKAPKQAKTKYLPPAPKATPSKKVQAVPMIQAALKRKEDRALTLKALMDTLSMSATGASTYYYNVKGGKWK